MANNFIGSEVTGVTSETTVYTGKTSTQSTVIGLSVANTSGLATLVSVKKNTAFIVKDATLATTLPTGINELKTRVDNINTAIGVSNDTYTASNTANYITLATSLFDADVKLDSQIKVNEDAIVQARIDIDGNALAYSIALG